MAAAVGEGCALISKDEDLVGLFSRAPGAGLLRPRIMERLGQGERFIEIR
jgi:hypothetical protein